MPVILRKFRENPSRLRQLSVIKKTQKFSKIGKIDKKLLKSSKNCYTGNIFKATEKRAAKGFDRTCRKRLFGLCGGRVRVWRSAALSPISICLRIRFDRAVFVALCLRRCVLLCLYAYGFVCCYDIRSCSRSRSFVIAVTASCLRLCVLFCAFMFAVYGSLYFCAVEVVCRCGFMFLLLSFPAARGFRFFELLKRSTAFLCR